jgi:hypothetical protein
MSYSFYLTRQAYDLKPASVALDKGPWLLSRYLSLSTDVLNQPEITILRLGRLLKSAPRTLKM